MLFADAIMHWALPRATAKLTLCRSQAPSRTSPVSVAIRRPSSFKKSLVEGPRAPVVSTAIGWNMYRSISWWYFCRLLDSARLAAYAGCSAVWGRFVAANVSLHVASHTSGFPFLNGKTVMPSGRRPSPRSNPGGSRFEGMPAVTRARLTTSFRAAWRGSLPALYRHDSGWWPSLSTTAPQRHRCGWQMSAPTRSATEMRKLSSSSSVPRVAVGRACSQAPESASFAAKSLARATWSARVTSSSYTRLQTGSSHALCFDLSAGYGAWGACICQHVRASSGSGRRSKLHDSRMRATRGSVE